ncbi:metallophosphoesterase [Nonomuraea ferruginea]
MVSDVHGRADALATAGDGADALICLGDLILFIDYDDHGQGIFADLFGAERAGEFIALRTAKRFDEARAMSAKLWASLDGDPRDHIERHVRAQYAELFTAMPAPTLPDLRQRGRAPPGRRLPQARPPGARRGDGGDRRAALRLRRRRAQDRLPHPPNEISDEEFAAKVEAVGEVDVLCCHIPPAVPELLYDVVARRFERGSEATLELIRRTQPRYALFGHVHQPLHRRTRIGRTECVNVGHFRGRGVPYVLEW